MADDREPYEPLWAAGLRREPQAAPDAARHAPEPAARRSFAGPAAAAFGILAVLWYAAVMAAVSDEVTITDVPSAWGPVPMTCTTLRVESPEGTLEAFECRALPTALRELPAGTYSSPDTIWHSDVDRREASAHLITISPAGELVGRAIYAG